MSPPALATCFSEEKSFDSNAIGRVGPLDRRGRYLHWDQMRHREPPAGITLLQWWGFTKLTRRTTARELPLRGVDGRAFSYNLPDPVLEALHRIDSDSRGNIGMDNDLLSTHDRDRYVISSLMEEAITSSQLEGASTTRRVAKEMLRSGRRPRTPHERMIANNYLAMQWVREHAKEPLTPSMVLELHRRVTADTLDDPRDAGRLRQDGEQIYVTNEIGDVLHTPPPANELPERLAQLCTFANTKTRDEGPFIHPIVRAILVHLWLAYDHPFVDGNGRTARALFYWAALRAEYWLLEFIAISRVLKQAPAKYGAAFLHTETDDNDATYFLVHQVNVIMRALDELESYICRSLEQRHATDALLRTCELNHRQVAIVRHALKHPRTDYTVRSHQNSHGVTYQTARTDLMGLDEQGLFEMRKVGRKHVWRAIRDLPQRLSSSLG